MATKKAYGLGATPGEIVTTRLALAAILVLAVVLISRRAPRREWNRTSLGTAVAAGFALWFNWRSELIGLSHLGPGVLILLATSPQPSRRSSPRWFGAGPRPGPSSRGSP